MDEKIVYLTKTLSRTNRKDSENYVVNTIWNRVNCPELVPVTQQLVRRNDGGWYFIDLFFPQLNIGVECDEQGHVGKEEQDKERELTIFHVLKQIKHEDYLPLHVEVKETTTFEAFDESINKCVQIIREAIKQKHIQNGWDSLLQAPADFYKNKENISIYDNVAFRTICEVCNNILGLSYDKYYRGSVKLPDGTYVWFPKLAINGRAVSGGWNNTISECGQTIIEFNENTAKNSERQAQEEHIGQERVVFTQVKDPVTKEKFYRFVGVFVAKKYNENGALIYERVDEKFKIIRP